MRVVFRTDASLEIGTGHVMRCLALATALSQLGSQAEFICRPHQGNLIELIEQRGFRVTALASVSSDRKASLDQPEHAHWLRCDWQTDVQQSYNAIADTADWIIVDHYALDHRWETAMRDKCHRMMCIDDLADREHHCDVLLDQSLGRCADDYHGLVPDHARLLLGPKYALLRPEFARWRAASLARREIPQVRHILITMGGVDATNVTGRVLSALQGIDIATLDQITVVLGPFAPWLDHVLAQAKNMSVPTRVLSDVDNMAELMTSCDLAIGAGGSTTWERCALGVPSILLVLAENQRNIAIFMAQASAAFVVEADEPTDLAVREAVVRFEDSGNLQSYSIVSSKICDGAGTARAVLELGNEVG